VTGLATARYDLAIVLPERDEDAIGLALGALLAALALSAATALALLLTGGVPMPAKLGGIRQYLWILPVAVMITGVAQVLQYWALRRGAYLRLSSSRVAAAVGSAAGQVTLGALGLGAWGLVLGSFLGQVTATGALLVGVSMAGVGSALRGRGPVLDTLRRYADFPKYTAPQSLMDELRSSAVAWILGAWFGTHVLGLYYLSVRVLQLPLSLIASSVSQVLFQRLSGLRREPVRCVALFNRVVWLLALAGAATGAVFLLFGPRLFGVLFGDKWGEAGVLAEITVPWLVSGFLTSGVSTVPLLVGKQRQFLLLGIGYNALVPSLLLAAAVLTGQARSSLLIMSLGAAGYLLYVLRSMRRMMLGYKA
jgi:O-antigen/teichoic acid export membrane protein